MLYCFVCIVYFIKRFIKCTKGIKNNAWRVIFLCVYWILLLIFWYSTWIMYCWPKGMVYSWNLSYFSHCVKNEYHLQRKQVYVLRYLLLHTPCNLHPILWGTYFAEYLKSSICWSRRSISGQSESKSNFLFLDQNKYKMLHLKKKKKELA